VNISCAHLAQATRQSELRPSTAGPCRLATWASTGLTVQ